MSRKSASRNRVRARKYRRFSRVESLESRIALSADVSLRLFGDDVFIRGTRGDDALVIEAVDGDLVVRGLDGTTVNGVESYVVPDAAEIADDLIVTLRAGDDRLDVIGIATGDDVWISSGSGDDLVVANRLVVGDDLRISSGSGDDEVLVLGSVIADDVMVHSSTGDDRLAIVNSTVDDRLDVHARAGDDLLFVGSVEVGGRSFISLGSGDDTARLHGANQFADRANLNGGSGKDSIQLDDAGDFDRLKIRRFESESAIEVVEFSSAEGLDVRNLPRGDAAGTGSTEFSLAGASFRGGEVFFAGQPPAYASPPSAYGIGVNGGEVNFDVPVDSASFFFVHSDGGSQTATAFDVDGNIIDRVTSHDMTFLADPGNMVTLKGDAAIARIAVTGGIIDNIAFQAITSIRFAASEGLNVRNIPGGDEAGTGSQSFTIGGASFEGGEVAFAGLPGAYASPPSAYFVGPAGVVRFSSPVSRARFFFVHTAGEPQTATAFDAHGNVVAVVSSRAATTLGDPANFVVLAGAMPIASIQITGGAIDNFAFVA